MHLVGFEGRAGLVAAPGGGDASGGGVAALLARGASSHVSAPRSRDARGRPPSVAQCPPRHETPALAQHPWRSGTPPIKHRNLPRTSLLQADLVVCGGRGAERLGAATAPKGSLDGERGRCEAPAASALQLRELSRSQEHPCFANLQTHREYTSLAKPFLPG